MTNLGERLSTIGGLLHQQTLTFEDGADESTNRLVVVRHQNTLGHNHAMLDLPCANRNK